MAKIEKKTKRYRSDLSDEEWSAAEPLMPPAHATGRRRQRDFRDILDAIRYMVRSGCEWRMVERTFGWLTRYRRLVRDYEAHIDVSEAMIHAQ